MTLLSGPTLLSNSSQIPTGIYHLFPAGALRDIAAMSSHTNRVDKVLEISPHLRQQK